MPGFQPPRPWATPFGNVKPFGIPATAFYFLRRSGPKPSKPFAKPFGTPATALQLFTAFTAFATVHEPVQPGHFFLGRSRVPFARLQNSPNPPPRLLAMSTSQSSHGTLLFKAFKGTVCQASNPPDPGPRLLAMSSLLAFQPRHSTFYGVQGQNRPNPSPSLLALQPRPFNCLRRSRLLRLSTSQSSQGTSF